MHLPGQGLGGGEDEQLEVRAGFGQGRYEGGEVGHGLAGPSLAGYDDVAKLCRGGGEEVRPREGLDTSRGGEIRREAVEELRGGEVGGGEGCEDGGGFTVAFTVAFTVIF